MAVVRSRYSGIGLLVLASLVVAVAILTNGSVSRAVNGVGGILWLVALVLVWRAIHRGERWIASTAAALALTFGLVLFVKPSDLGLAMVGFGIAGALMGLLVRRQELLWAALIPALWLPVHLSVAISRAVMETASDQTASVRTDPPPTEAFVPFAMVVAAILGGVTVSVWRARRPTSGTESAGRDAVIGTSR